MQSQRRSSTRVLSSLRDLKLKDIKSGFSGESQANTRRRQSKKCVIRGDVFQDNKFFENFTKVDTVKTRLDLDFIGSCLSKHFVFSQLAQDFEVMEDVLDKFFCCEVKEGEFIMKQGDDASTFFVLETGKFSVIINGEHRREILPGQGFGELALLYSAPRSASVQALQTCTLWGIDRNTFKRVVAEVCEKQYFENRKFIEKVKFFEYLTPKQKDSVANVLIQQKYHRGDKIVIQGDPASSFYILKSGTANVIVNNQQTGTLTTGGYFGEAALISSSQLRNATIAADSDCTVLALGRDSIKGILGQSIHIIVYRNRIASFLSNSQIFSQLDNLSIERIIDSLEILKVLKDQIITSAGQKCRQRMFFVLEGSIVKSPNSIEVEGYTFYGEEGMKGDHSEQTYSTDLKFQGEGVIAYTNFNKIIQAIGGSYQQIVQRNKNLSTVIAKHQESVKNFKEAAQNIKLQDLRITKKLGFGQFGVVYLASYKDNFYALKCIDKSQIIECKLERQLRQQKEVLDKSNHPFILQYGRSFKDDRFVYFLTEFINGLQLFDVIRDIGLLSSKDSKFYIASMVLSLQYLHAQQILYRDLKPQNIIIDKYGYVKLIDMGTCKLLQNKSSRTFTIIGTPHYMAPEVLAAKGYNSNADLWSLGVCLYEFMCGYVPFGEDADDPYEIYEQIIKKELEFPKHVADQKAVGLMNQLLCKKQEIRLGGSFSVLKNHPWFAQFEWDMLLSRKMVPPYRIPPSKLTDLKLIDAKKGRTIKAELEQVMPKSKAARSQRKDFDKNWDVIF